MPRVLAKSAPAKSPKSTAKSDALRAMRAADAEEVDDDVDSSPPDSSPPESDPAPAPAPAPVATAGRKPKSGYHRTYLAKMSEPQRAATIVRRAASRLGSGLLTRRVAGAYVGASGTDILAEARDLIANAVDALRNAGEALDEIPADFKRPKKARGEGGGRTRGVDKLTVGMTVNIREKVLGTYADALEADELVGLTVTAIGKRVRCKCAGSNLVIIVPRGHLVLAPTAQDAQ